MSSNLYREVVRELVAAGFKLARQNGHDVWKKDGRGVTFSRKINNPYMKRQILREVGLR